MSTIIGVDMGAAAGDVTQVFMRFATGYRDWRAVHGTEPRAWRDPSRAIFRHHSFASVASDPAVAITTRQIRAFQRELRGGGHSVFEEERLEADIDRLTARLRRRVARALGVAQPPRQR